jgi:hypothetical protein
MTRPPYFELHIRPMFRLIDCDHMRPYGLELFDYDSIVTNKEAISEALKNGMPPADAGGPWPEEWIALFERWVSLECPRLQLASGVTYSLTRMAGTAQLKAEGQTPGANIPVWFERLNENESPREYVLYFAAAGNPGPPQPFTATEALPEEVTSVSVRDADGSRTVSL